jgi:hypothetical protein
MKKIKIKNNSNKLRSKKSIDELKNLAFKVCNDLKIYDIIDSCNINYTKKLNYYRDSQPLYGFKKLFNNNKVTIDLAEVWDTSQYVRKLTIIHELTHAKQMIDKRLIINDNCNSVIWNGKVVNTWRKFKFTEFNKLKTNKEKDKYIKPKLPWELEVRKNVSKLLD